MRKGTITWIGIIVFAVAVILYVYNGRDSTPIPTPDENIQIPSSTSNPPKRAAPTPEVITDNLETPWEIEFLPNGGFLLTERVGRLLKIEKGRKAIQISGVEHIGEGGLLGMALHPNFEQNQWIYFYFTTRSGNGLVNRVERYVLDGTTLSQRTVILEGIPGAQYHDGGRIAFGPDGKLYITTGDASQSDSAQNINSLAGKILRLNDDGSIPSDNPYGNAVYSYGHRNVQGITWDDSGRLWATEHGRSGVRSGLDELNLITKGGNYGWPAIQGDETKEGMISPIIHSGPDVTWAPSGMIYDNDTLYFAGLRGESIYKADISDPSHVSIQTHFNKKFGRLRTIKKGPDGFLYVLTNNQDGRGDPRAGDDKVIKIHPDVFN